VRESCRAIRGRSRQAAEYETATVGHEARSFDAKKGRAFTVGLRTVVASSLVLMAWGLTVLVGGQALIVGLVGATGVILTALIGLLKLAVSAKELQTTDRKLEASEADERAADRNLETAQANERIADRALETAQANERAADRNAEASQADERAASRIIEAAYVNAAAPQYAQNNLPIQSIPRGPQYPPLPPPTTVSKVQYKPGQPAGRSGHRSSRRRRPSKS
jgi:hypothetical protein